jgi:hypothetical protein
MFLIQGFVPNVGELVAQAPQEWFFNTPLLWLTAIVLMIFLRASARCAGASEEAFEVRSGQQYLPGGHDQSSGKHRSPRASRWPILGENPD